MYENILVPTDGSDAANEAAEHAIELASNFDATVHALYVVEPERTTLPSEGMRYTEVHEEYVEWGKEITSSVAESSQERGLRGTAAVREGRPHEEIADYAAENAIDLVVMGTAGRSGLRERLLGSVTEKTARICEVPVLMMREEADG